MWCKALIIIIIILWCKRVTYLIEGHEAEVQRDAVDSNSLSMAAQVIFFLVQHHLHAGSGKYIRRHQSAYSGADHRRSHFRNSSTLALSFFLHRALECSSKLKSKRIPKVKFVAENSKGCGLFFISGVAVNYLNGWILKG